MRHFVPLSLLLSVACVASSAIAANSEGERTRQPTIDALQAERLHSTGTDTPSLLVKKRLLSSSGGISHAQAMDIARGYFALVGCGALDGVTDTGDAWKVEGRTGYAGTPIEGVLIDKATGALTLPKARNL